MTYVIKEVINSRNLAQIAMSDMLKKAGSFHFLLCINHI